MLAIFSLTASFVLNFANAFVSQIVLVCFVEQFLTLIPQYTSCTYSTNNGFKLPLGQNNFLCL